MTNRGVFEAVTFFYFHILFILRPIIAGISGNPEKNDREAYEIWEETDK
jgi:hypothetical protein